MKKLYLVIASIFVIVTLSVYGCTSNTTIIQQPTTTVTNIITQSTTLATTTSSITLSSITINALAEVNMNISALCFFPPTDDQYHTEAYALNMLTQYQKCTSDLTVQIIDPNQNPDEAREYGITDSSLYESVVFKTDKGTITVTPTQIVNPATSLISVENYFTNAILQVTGQQEKKVYFVVGDGETSPNDTLSDLAASLNANLLQVMTINLKVTTNIPSDCAVLVVAGPTTSMTAGEHQIIASYLAKDGCAIFLTNPNAPNDIAQLLSPWGVNVQSNTLIDTSSYVAPNMNILQIPSARDYVGETNVYFPGATAIIAQTTAPTNMDVTPLVWTTSKSWLAKNYDSSVTPKFDPSTEIQQSYAVGVLIKPTDISNNDGTDSGIPYPGPYIIAFGDSDFISNANFYSVNNADMFLRLVNYLGAGFELVTIPPSPPK